MTHMPVTCGNIVQGQTVRILLHPNSSASAWTLGICTDQLRDRSYEVIVNGKQYGRNRKAIWPVTEQLRIPANDHQTNMDEDDWGPWEEPAIQAGGEQQAADMEAAPPPQNITLRRTRTKVNTRAPVRYSKDYVVSSKRLYTVPP